MPREPELTVSDIYQNLSGIAALLAAEQTSMCKVKGEKDMEFVKRIVAHYLRAATLLGVHG